jgi:SpoVK/Ycf46/Vps4 family AAA+-type ATPase
VKSYVIKIDTITTKTTIPNKKYIEYSKQKDTLFELAKINKENKDNETSDMEIKHKISEFMKLTIPPEEKKKIKSEKQIVVSEINEIYKSFNTLYLREHDKFKLKNVLEMFKDDNETWKEMGIPNKLGILLYGIMGTGKSSAISAIATYLQKNIYCVDFKTIKTNSDFLMVVDYVNKNCLGGGILTFEDFDAMSNVLHKRVDNSEVVNSNVDLYNSSKQDLTLDFILNVFQGSMTPSGFVFVGTTNHLDVLDEALYRDGRFDIKIEMKLCDYYQIQCIYNKLIGRNITEDILTRIEENKWTPANIIFRVMHYVRGDHTDEIILQPFFTK